MKKILLTGSTGFIGKNISPFLREQYNLFTPTRTELDLSDYSAVGKYLHSHKFDVIIHLANPTGQNPIDANDIIFDKTLRVFTSLDRCSDLYGKMIYVGSGAEYGKQRNLSMIREEDFGKIVPKDAYGFTRYIISKLAERHKNVINLRLFACCGRYDPKHKLIPHIISCIDNQKEIRLHQNALYDFLYVGDILKVLTHFITNDSMHQAYNLCSGNSASLSDIAENIKQLLNYDKPVVFEKSGMAHEYTASNERLLNAIPKWNPLSTIQAAINTVKETYC